MPAEGTPAADGPQHSATATQKTESRESPLREAFEWAHFFYDALEIVSPKWHHALKAFLIALPPIILRIVYGGQFTTWWQLFVLTSPLTIAVGVIITVWNREYLGKSGGVYFVFSGLILTAAAFVSSWSGIGTAPHVTGSPLASPVALVVAYYKLYHAPAFFTSVGAGLLLGHLCSKE